MSERADTLRERARADFPEAWIPDREGDEFVGYFQRLEQGRTSFGPCAIAIFAEDDTGAERALWLFHTALRNELARCRPAAGELVYVRYEGRREPAGGGQAYESYRVVVDRDGGAISWADLADDPVPPPPEQDGRALQDDDVPF